MRAGALWGRAWTGATPLSCCASRKRVRFPAGMGLRACRGTLEDKGDRSGIPGHLGPRLPTPQPQIQGPEQPGNSTQPGADLFNPPTAQRQARPVAGCLSTLSSRQPSVMPSDRLLPPGLHQCSQSCWEQVDSFPPEGKGPSNRLRGGN